MDVETMKTIIGDQIILGFTLDDARSTLIQAMMDETIRLRKTTDKKEKDSIRGFLTESYRALSENWEVGWLRDIQEEQRPKFLEDDLSCLEADLICKFRLLDDRGKSSVVSSLDFQYGWVTGIGKPSTGPGRR